MRFFEATGNRQRTSVAYKLCEYFMHYSPTLCLKYLLELVADKFPDYDTLVPKHVGVGT